MRKKLLVAAMLSAFMLTSILIGCTSNKQSSQNTTPGSNTTTTINKTFTIDDLKKYNGQNGNAAYVAVDGKVYDVSNAKKWRNGRHENGAVAGIDLTNMIGQSPHGKSVLSQIPVVGVLK